MSELASIAKDFLVAQSVRPSIDEYQTKLASKDRITSAVEESLERARIARLGHELIFYIAGPLTGVDEQTKQRYIDTSQAIEAASRVGSRLFGYAPHLHGTDPIKHPNVTPNEVRDIDYLWSTVVADGHINFWTPVAHGNGIEEGWAEEHDIPSLYVRPHAFTPSRIVRGMWNAVRAIEYDNFEADGLPQVEEFLGELQKLRLGRAILPLADREQL